MGKTRCRGHHGLGKGSRRGNLVSPAETIFCGLAKILSRSNSEGSGEQATETKIPFQSKLKPLLSSFTSVNPSYKGCFYPVPRLNAPALSLIGERSWKLHPSIALARPELVPKHSEAPSNAASSFQKAGVSVGPNSS